MFRVKAIIFVYKIYQHVTLLKITLMKKIFTTLFSICVLSAAGFAQISLPFIENFSNGVNNWTKDPNWRVSNTMGNPMPCIVFYGTMTSYEQSLNTNELNGTNVIGGITLAFDFALSAINATGTEFVAVEVDNGTGWVQIVEFSNQNGGFSWETKTYNITDLVIGTNFKVRFRSHGADAANNNYWMLDNVRVTVSPVDVKEIDQPTAEIYPNPTQGNSVTFKLTPEIKEYVVYDLLGNILLTGTTNSQNLNFPVNINHLKNGIYPVKFISKSGKSVTKKLIITK